MIELRLYEFEVGRKLTMINKFQGILQTQFSALLGVDF